MSNNLIQSFSTADDKITITGTPNYSDNNELISIEIEFTDYLVNSNGASHKIKLILENGNDKEIPFQHKLVNKEDFSLNQFNDLYHSLIEKLEKKDQKEAAKKLKASLNDFEGTLSQIYESLKDIKNLDEEFTVRGQAHLRKVNGMALLFVSFIYGDNENYKQKLEGDILDFSLKNVS